MKQTKSFEIDMCNGTLMDKLISFSIPLMLSGILQLMFNAVDIIVVGRFARKRIIGGSRFYNRPHQCIYQPFYRHFLRLQCPRCPLLCSREGAGNVGNGT